jgi:hypothetical protein
VKTTNLSQVTDKLYHIKFKNWENFANGREMGAASIVFGLGSGEMVQERTRKWWGKLFKGTCKWSG